MMVRPCDPIKHRLDLAVEGAVRPPGGENGVPDLTRRGVGAAYSSFML